MLMCIRQRYIWVSDTYSNIGDPLLHKSHSFWVTEKLTTHKFHATLLLRLVFNLLLFSFSPLNNAYDDHIYCLRKILFIKDSLKKKYIILINNLKFLLLIYYQFIKYDIYIIYELKRLIRLNNIFIVFIFVVFRILSCTFIFVK